MLDMKPAIDWNKAVGQLSPSTSTDNAMKIAQRMSGSAWAEAGRVGGAMSVDMGAGSRTSRCWPFVGLHDEPRTPRHSAVTCRGCVMTRVVIESLHVPIGCAGIAGRPPQRMCGTISLAVVKE